MKRWIVVTSLLVVIAFVAGFASALVLRRSNFKQIDEYYRTTIAERRHHIYGPNLLHELDLSETKARLAEFDSSKSKGSITLSYVGGMDGHIGGSDLHLQLFADGALEYRNRDRKQLVTTLSPERCTAIFRRFLSSGILNYSEGVVELKRDLLRDGGGKSVTDSPLTGFLISVPEMGVEKSVSVHTPDVELENFPDIVEYEIIILLEKEFTDLVPKDFPLWK